MWRGVGDRLGLFNGRRVLGKGVITPPIVPCNDDGEDIRQGGRILAEGGIIRRSWLCHQNVCSRKVCAQRMTIDRPHKPAASMARATHCNYTTATRMTTKMRHGTLTKRRGRTVYHFPHLSPLRGWG